MDLYREIILDHYKNPRNFGHLDKPDYVAEGSNATCGDKIRMEIKFTVSLKGKHSSQFTVKDIKFSGTGCALSVAAASMLTEKVKGMKKEDVLKLGSEDVYELLGTTVTLSRVKCANLPLEVLHQTLLK